MKNIVRLGLRHLRRTFVTARKPVGLVLASAVSVSVIASPPLPSNTGKNPVKAHHWFEIGNATWYGRAFQGKRTATGERFDMNALTCAHRTLPLGSWLRVTNLRNHRSTFVRVNDRGPFGSGSIVDLSYAAARRVGVLGRSSVRVEQVSPDDPELAYSLLAQLSMPDLLVRAHP